MRIIDFEIKEDEIFAEIDTEALREIISKATKETVLDLLKNLEVCFDFDSHERRDVGYGISIFNMDFRFNAFIAVEEIIANTTDALSYSPDETGYLESLEHIVSKLQEAIFAIKAKKQGEENNG